MRRMSQSLRTLVLADTSHRDPLTPRRSSSRRDALEPKRLDVAGRACRRVNCHHIQFDVGRNDGEPLEETRLVVSPSHDVRAIDLEYLIRPKLGVEEARHGSRLLLR